MQQRFFQSIKPVNTVTQVEEIDESILIDSAKAGNVPAMVQLVLQDSLTSPLGETLPRLLPSLTQKLGSPHAVEQLFQQLKVAYPQDEIRIAPALGRLALIHRDAIQAEKYYRVGLRGTDHLKECILGIQIVCPFPLTSELKLALLSQLERDYKDFPNALRLIQEASNKTMSQFDQDDNKPDNDKRARL